MALIEKRKEHRIRVSLPIEISSLGRPKFKGKTGNISRLGAYVEIDEEFPLGEDVMITLDIPKYSGDISLSGEVKCKGSIFRCDLLRQVGMKKDYGVGIFFTDFPGPLDKNKLSAYVDFLILKEDKLIKDGLRQKREKRQALEEVKHAPQIQLEQQDFQRQAINLLREIIQRLKEIRALLKS